MVRYLVLVLLAADLACAGAAREVTWDGVSQFTGKTIRLVMPDAVPVSGTLAAVEKEALSLSVRASANKVKYPKGQLLRVARADVRTFEVQRNSKHWRIAGTAVGFVAGAVAAAGIELTGGLFGSRSTARDVAAVSVWSGATIGGFFLGRAADRRSFTVVVLPGDGD